MVFYTVRIRITRFKSLRFKSQHIGEMRSILAFRAGMTGVAALVTSKQSLTAAAQLKAEGHSTKLSVRPRNYRPLTARLVLVVFLFLRLKRRIDCATRLI